MTFIRKYFFIFSMLLFILLLDRGKLVDSSEHDYTKESTNQNETVTENNSTFKPSVKAPALPDENAQEEEHKSSIAIFFILFVIVLTILLIHLMHIYFIHYIPESLAIVILGAFIGLIVRTSNYHTKLLEAEALSPNAFFLILLPPIIFEGGYNLHKGNFFANIGSILTFAIVGTTISTVFIGAGIYILGQADLVYKLGGLHSFAFGALISAVDPVATLAIFQALNVDPLLYMLVFGESMLNDAVAIVLTTTVLSLNSKTMNDAGFLAFLYHALSSFLYVFITSAFIGVVAAALSAFLLKHVDLRKTPSLEFALLLVFAYLPYGLAEGLHLSGIMAILFCGVCMSHYTHFNLSPMTQITMQQTFRTLAFVCEACVFAYLGLAIFTFPLKFKPMLSIWSIIMCLAGRALNIFPLSWLCNRYRAHKITKKMQFVMWFSGLRGAIAFALSLFMVWDSDETRSIMIANTLIIVLFTTMVLGGATMPLLNILNTWFSEETDELKRKKRKRRRRANAMKQPKAAWSGRRSGVNLSKTQEMNVVIETGAEYSFSDYATENERSKRNRRISTDNNNQNWNPLAAYASSIVDIDTIYVRPFLVRKFTAQEKQESTMKLTNLAFRWFENAAQVPSDEDETDANINSELPNIKANENLTTSTNQLAVDIPNTPISSISSVQCSNSSDERPLI